MSFNNSIVNNKSVAVSENNCRAYFGKLNK